MNHQDDPLTKVPLSRRRLLRAAATVGAGAAVAGLGLEPAYASGSSAGATNGEPAGATMTAATRRAVQTARKVGAYDVVALRDATGPFFLTAAEAFPDATSRDWKSARRLDPDAFGPGGAWHLDFRCFAIRRPCGRITLVDAGVGPEGSPASSWAPVPGRLPEALIEAGIDVRDVDMVVLTHLHEDHCGWSVTPDGVPLFPNARYVIQQTEIAALETGGDQTIISYVVEPLRRAGQLHPVSGAVLLDGNGVRAGRRGGPAGRAGNRITVVPTPGHTLGHQSVLVEGAGRQIMITGDVLVHAVQLVNPDVGYRYERDQDLARQTRRSVLERAEQGQALLATAHLRQPFVPMR